MDEVAEVTEVTRIADAAEAADGASPLDEAARIALADGAATVAVADGGFALVHDGDLSLAVHPDVRDRGVGTALLQRVAAYDGELVAWSHGNHPAAARLAAAHGWERVRDLWVMRRDASLPLPPVELPDGAVDPLLRRRRRGRRRGRQRGRLREPPRAGRDGPRQPRAADGRAVVRPGRTAGRGGRVRRARLPLDQAARRRARRGVRRRRLAAGAGPRARPAAHPGRAPPPRRPRRRRGAALRRGRQRARARRLLTPGVRARGRGHPRAVPPAPLCYLGTKWGPAGRTTNEIVPGYQRISGGGGRAGRPRGRR